MKVLNLDHLVITANDIDKTVHFYCDILGMQLDMTNNRYAVKFGNQKFNLHRGKAEFLPAALNVTFGSQDICLIMEGKIEDIEAELKEKGVEIELGIVKRTGANGSIDSIYLRDPDGNLVELSVYQN